MALIYPDIQTIQKLKPKPTDGEVNFLNFLIENLSDDFEIYFQPYLNGDNPDIIIMKKGSGILIVEVKDWNLDSYKLDNNKNWTLKNINNNRGDQQIIKSPLRQVKEYKENIYNLHIENLLEKKIANNKYFSIVNCALYFHKATENEIAKFGDKDDYIDMFGSDNLNKDYLNGILTKRRLHLQSYLFNDELYESFKRLFQPIYHTLEQGVEIRYSKKQTELIEKTDPKQQKIKGVAGSGKTLILAKKAVDSHKKTLSKILILTFNITLKNYIHDNINNVREGFDWKNFYIIHYHQFINAEANNLNIKINNLGDYDNENLFDGFEIIKYKTICIDEIQDYKTEWIKIIKRYFLAEDGEFIVFGDEKQNIYERILDQERKPNTTITGRWNDLNESFRLSEKIANLATKFQRHFFQKKYDLDSIQIIKQTSLFSSENIKYVFLEKQTSEDIVRSFLEMRGSVHSNDICLLSSDIVTLRELDFQVRKITKERTKTTFETKEIFDKVSTENPEHLMQEIENIRQNKKFNFWMNSGTIKLSTIHSFKGWEIPTLFLIINIKDQNDELIYTAITRCRYNLFIFNIGNKRYDDFLKKNIDLFND